MIDLQTKQAAVIAAQALYHAIPPARQHIHQANLAAVLAAIEVEFVPLSAKEPANEPPPRSEPRRK